MKEFEDLYDTFYSAHTATSFSPEKQAARLVAQFSEELTADLEELDGREGNYKEKYIAHVTTWIHRQGRCMSWFITGPANFPTAKNNKLRDSEEKAWEEFREWRKRYIQRANAVRTKSPEEEIDLALAELDKEKTFHEMLLIVSKILRTKETPIEKFDKIKDQTTFEDKVIHSLFEPWSCSSSLSSSNAKIKRLADKLKVMRSRVARKETFEPIVFDGGTITIENDRVCIRHDHKPEKAVMDSLRGSGFRWSPHMVCWCRKHTLQAIMDAKRITGVTK